MNRIGALTIGLCLLATLVLPGCGKKAENSGQDVLATVNNQPITTQDLQIAWKAMPEAQRKNYYSPQGILSLLDELVSYKMMALEAENRKLDQDPTFKKRMEIFRERLLVNALTEGSIPDADVMNHFQSKFLRANFIRIPFPAGATDAQKAEAKAKAEQALAKLSAGMGFDEAIEEFSFLAPDETGNMGYVTHLVIERMTSFSGAEALFGLKEPGQHTGIIEGKDGWYIFQLVESPGKLDVRGLTPEFAAAIRDELREPAIRSMVNELKSRQEFTIVRNQENVNVLMKSLKENWARTSEGETISPEPGSTAAPAPGTTTPVAPTAGTTASGTAPAPGATAPAPAAPPATPAPGNTPAAPAAGATPKAP